MANVTIWDGSATFNVGDTPFGFYDTDTDFQTDAVKVAKFCGTRLGYPLMDVELQDLDLSLHALRKLCQLLTVMKSFNIRFEKTIYPSKDRIGSATGSKQ